MVNAASVRGCWDAAHKNDRRGELPILARDHSERSYIYGPENPALGTKLQKMLGRAGYPQIAEVVDMAAVTEVLPDVEARAGVQSHSRRPS